MESLILKADELLYSVVDAKGKVLKETLPRRLAEKFVDELDENEQVGVMLVPVTPEGKQVLFG